MASIRRGHSCGSTTRRISCHDEAPRVCALMSCSPGSSAVRKARSRTMTGVTPMMMSVTFAASPRPTTMNKMGRMASGGISDKAATKGARVARR